MSALGDVVKKMKVPATQKARLSRAELDEAADRLHGSASNVRAGTSKIRALSAVLSVAIDEFGGFMTERAKQEAAEAALEAIRLEAELAEEEGAE